MQAGESKSTFVRFSAHPCIPEKEGGSHSLISVRIRHADHSIVRIRFQIRGIHSLRADEDELLFVRFPSSVDLRTYLSVRPREMTVSTYQHLGRHASIDIVQENIPFVQASDRTGHGLPQGQKQTDRRKRPLAATKGFDSFRITLDAMLRGLCLSLPRRAHLNTMISDIDQRTLTNNDGQFVICVIEIQSAVQVTLRHVDGERTSSLNTEMSTHFRPPQFPALVLVVRNLPFVRFHP